MPCADLYQVCLGGARACEQAVCTNWAVSVEGDLGVYGSWVGKRGRAAE